MNKFKLYIVTSLLAALVSLSPAGAEAPQPDNSAEPQRPLMSQTIADSLRNGHILLNFENIDLKVLSRMMSELTGRNIIVDDKVKGKLTILSSRPVSIDEAWGIFKAALDRSGYTVQNKGEYVQILPNASARNVGQFISASTANPWGEEYVMAVLIMNQANPESIEKAVKPLLSENGVISAYKDGLALLVVDRSSIVSRIGQIVKSLDGLEMNLDTEVIFPKYMEAEKVINAVKPIFQEKEGRKEFAITAFGPSNGVIVSGRPKDIKKVRDIIQKLDIPMAAPVKTEPARFFIYNLQYAQAKDVAKILSDMLSERQKAVENRLKESKVPANQDNNETSKTAEPGEVADSNNATGKKDKPNTVGFTSSKVSADEETNSLVLYVSPSEYDELKSVIAKLDSERSQIQISAVVAEVTLKRAEELGIGWQALTSGGIIGSYKGGLTEEGLLNVLAGGNFVTGVVGSGTRSITVSNQTVDVPEFFAYLDAMNDKNYFNLISAPRVLTQDNKKAKINVGQVVPFATGGKLDAYGSPVVTFDYREVGVKLDVTPHMSRTGKIRMDVKQEIQEVTGYLNQEMAGVKFSAPIVSNRSVETTVTIPDGKTLLIGGLISKRTSDQLKGVPILKDLPLLGWLFRDKSTEEQKVTIFVSLTPKIINLDDQVQIPDSSLQPYLDGNSYPGSQNYEDRTTIDPSKPSWETPSSADGIKVESAEVQISETEDTPNRSDRMAKQGSKNDQRKVFDDMDTTKVVYTNPQQKSNTSILRTASTSSQPSQAIYQEEQADVPLVVPVPIEIEKEKP